MNLATIVITGVAGFLGSSLAEYCLRHGHTVVGFDNLSRGSESNLSEIIDNEQFRFIELDLTNQQQLETNFPEADVCFHLAAINGTVFFHERALDVISSNIGMTMNVLRLCMQISTRLVFSSSPEAFGLVESMPLEDYNESKFPAAQDHQRFSYGATKYVEELAMHYGARQSLDVRIVRPFNVYGPRLRGKKDGQVIGRFLSQLLSNEPLELHYEGKHTRSFTYIDDAIEGIYKAGLLDVSYLDGKPLSGMSFNIGSDQEHQMIDVAKLLISLCQSERIALPDKPMILVESGYPGDSTRRSCQPQAAREHLHWEPKTTLEDGLLLMIQDVLRQSSLS